MTGSTQPAAQDSPRPPLAFIAFIARAGRFRAPVLLWLLARIVLVSWAVGVMFTSGGGWRMLGRPNWPFMLFYHWDSVYFAHIANRGYFGTGSLTTWQAFFPGYPAAARIVAFGFGGAHPSIAQIQVGLSIVAAIGSLVATVLFWHLVWQFHGRRIAIAATVLLLAGPYSLFLIASYSESLFLTFAIGAWLLAGRGSWMWGGILAAAASLTRINGLFLVAALVVLYIRSRQARGLNYRGGAIGLAAIGFSGTGLYFLYLWVRTGNLFAWSTAETLGWDRTTRLPWATFSETLTYALTLPMFDGRMQAWLEIVFAVLLVLACVLLVRRRLWAEAVMVGLTLLSLMTSSSYLSLARTSVVLFPIPILLATTLTSPRWRWVYWTGVSVGVLLLLVNTALFTQGHWAD